MRSFSGALLDSSEMNPAENSAHEQQHVSVITTKTRKSADPHGRVYDSRNSMADGFGQYGNFQKE
jgi:hypothetical protein